MNEAKRKLVLGNNVSVWWPCDKCAYDATIMRLSDKSAELLYDDGTLKKYERQMLVPRMAAASVCERPVQNAITRNNLHPGSSIHIWRPHDQQPHEATIVKMSKVHVTVQYTDSGKSENYTWAKLLPNMLPSALPQPNSTSETQSFDSCLGVGSSFHSASARRELFPGNKINVFWPRDRRSYKGIVTKVSGSHVHVLYDDGHRKTYPLAALLRASRRRALQTTMSLSVCTPRQKITAIQSPQMFETKKSTSEPETKTETTTRKMLTTRGLRA